MNDYTGSPKSLVDKSCCFSFGDLYIAAFNSDMPEIVRLSLRSMNQDEKNATVRDWVRRTNGKFVCQDRRGTDNIIYTAFWAE